MNYKYWTLHFIVCYAYLWVSSIIWHCIKTYIVYTATSSDENGHWILNEPARNILLPSKQTLGRLRMRDTNGNFYSCFLNCYKWIHLSDQHSATLSQYEQNILQHSITLWQYDMQNRLQKLPISRHIGIRLKNYVECYYGKQEPMFENMKCSWPHDSKSDCLAFVRYLVGAPCQLMLIRQTKDIRGGDVVYGWSQLGFHVGLFITPQIVIHKLGGSGDIVMTDFPSVLRPYFIKKNDYKILRPVDTIFDNSKRLPQFPVYGILNDRNAESDFTIFEK